MTYRVIFFFNTWQKQPSIPTAGDKAGKPAHVWTCSCVGVQMLKLLPHKTQRHEEALDRDDSDPGAKCTKSVSPAAMKVGAVSNYDFMGTSIPSLNEEISQQHIKGARQAATCGVFESFMNSSSLTLSLSFSFSSSLAHFLHLRVVEASADALLQSLSPR